MKVGETRTAILDLKSDGVIPWWFVPWFVRAYDSVELYGGTPELKITIAPGRSGNSDKLEMTITRLRNGQFGGSLVYVYSDISSSEYRSWLSFVAN